ncbi:MAG: cation:dicarboxylase symporter family transporter [Bacteroidota bacterium]|nr:cation:dicarboxylase symporter family transporter [Candidatus Kapabacteria bacterium]MCS7303190.1 cation:dicarboxylase symporter family transporter [Candidatus Kapabacteria bacterium]MCX7937016.1 cation:dicarboxylase symporter family transporter [Chlorobiota bacterium]MDW8075487.1 cation:dicarboxylase symporter family transporter [Bacteroidota bacterium]MDW8272344.1 cation:dicarboxylase symporter family transporter [Bacteroidota bacterium]
MPSARQWWRLSLTQQILLGLAIGTALGALVPGFATELKFLRDIFLNLIKSIIAPLVFGSVVAGIAGSGTLRAVGRIGAKSLLYFEIVTTLALVVGLVVVNITTPGAGLVLNTDGSNSAEQLPASKPKTLIETLVHIFPASIIESMARGDILQIVAFSTIFGLATAAAGERAQSIVQWCEALAQVMFRFTELVMRFAPIGIGAAMAYAIGHQGLGVLVNLGELILSLYVALAIFVAVVFGAVAAIIRLPVRAFIEHVREPFMLAFVTTSSESALPKAMENMERFGVPRRIVGFVMPLGYSFNLDGTTLYLAMASVFLAQAIESTTGQHFSFGQQLMLMLALMVTSKGVAAVPRASLVVLLATASSFMDPSLVAIGVAVIFGVDEFMDMARTSVNLLGNCLATVVIARWEGCRWEGERLVEPVPSAVGG